MSEHTIKAAGRTDEGKGASRRLRHAAQIPAIVYGGKSEPKSIQLEHEHIWLASQHEWFYSSILNLDIDGKVEQVLLRDMQRHPYRQLIMHLDFQRISANETLRASVPLHFINEELSPAGKASDVVVMKELTQVEVSCLPKDLPEFIEVDLAELTDSPKATRRMVSASSSATLSWRIRPQAFAASESGMVSVTTSSSSCDFVMLSIAAPESTGCVQ